MNLFLGRFILLFLSYKQLAHPQATGFTLAPFVVENKVEIVPDATVACDRSMRGDKFRDATGYVSPSWPDMVRALAADPTPYQEWRAR